MKVFKLLHTLGLYLASTGLYFGQSAVNLIDFLTAVIIKDDRMVYNADQRQYLADIFYLDKLINEICLWNGEKIRCMEKELIDFRNKLVSKLDLYKELES